MDDFRKDVLKIKGPRKHKVKNSLGVYDAYKYIRRNKWFNIGQPLTEHQFYTIIRTINLFLSDQLLEGHDIQLPCRMGKLELRKNAARINIKDNKVQTNLPIDWDKTLKLWAEDEESYKKRTLIKMEEKEIYKVYYNKSKADFNNKSFFGFNLNRSLKQRLKEQIKNGNLDAFKLWRDI